jgi:hypothetical protein
VPLLGTFNLGYFVLAAIMAHVELHLQIDVLRSKLDSGALVFGPKACDCCASVAAEKKSARGRATLRQISNIASV